MPSKKEDLSPTVSGEQFDLAVCVVASADGTRWLFRISPEEQQAT
jgi:hypothetical protein